MLSDPEIGSSFYTAVYALAGYLSLLVLPLLISLAYSHLVGQFLLSVVHLTECPMGLSWGDKGVTKPHDMLSLGGLSQQCSDPS